MSDLVGNPEDRFSHKARLYLPMPSPLYWSLTGVDMANPLLRLKEEKNTEFAWGGLNKQCVYTVNM